MIGLVRVRTALIIVALLAVAALGYAKVVAPSLEPRRFSEVVPGQIYRSGRVTPGALARVVGEHQIKTIIDLGASPPGSDGERREQKTAEALGVKRVSLWLEGDSRGDPNNYVYALRLMTDPAARPVLVHCSAGTERTGCAVILYRHLIEGVDLEKALAEATEKGHDTGNPHLRMMVETFKEPVRESLRTGRPIEGWREKMR